MENTDTIAIPFEEIAGDRSFDLLEKPITCPHCDGECFCEGYNGHALVYRCLVCDAHILDELDFEPLFAADILHVATVQHYEIDCPYCGERAPLVGGSGLEGLYFVCKNRCHVHRVRFIRRY